MKVLQVMVKRKPEGGNLYPNFDLLDVVIASPLIKIHASGKWARYISEWGSGWLVDPTSDHRSVSVDSPRGMSLGMMILPDEFVDQAVVKFPTTCKELNEADAQIFYESKVSIRKSADDPLKTWAGKKTNMGM